MAKQLMIIVGFFVGVFLFAFFLLYISLRIENYLGIGSQNDFVHISFYNIYHFYNGIFGDDYNIENVDYSYKGTITNEKRYLSIGFDDFRESDFSMVIPMFNEYNAKATFNSIAFPYIMYDDTFKKNIELVANSNDELGNHTWFHQGYIYNDPLFNGQNLDDIDGNQNPYPSNEQMCENIGGGITNLGLL